MKNYIYYNKGEVYMREKDNIMKEKIMKDILESCDEKIDINLVFKKALEYVADILDFNEPNPEDLLEISEEEKTAIDTHVFKRYNNGVRSPFGIGTLICEIEDPGENVFKCEFNKKELIIGFSDGVDCSDYLLKRRTRIRDYRYDFTFLINVKTKKRLHVESSICFSTKPVYDKGFVDYEKYLDEYDLKNDKEFKRLLSDRFSELKNETTLNLVKYKLLEEQKDFLANICAMYNFPVRIVLKDGILCIESCIVRQMKIRIIFC